MNVECIMGAEATFVITIRSHWFPMFLEENILELLFLAGNICSSHL